MLANWVWLIAWCMSLVGVLRGEGGQGSLPLQQVESCLNELLFVIAELRLRGKRKDISCYHSGTLTPPSLIVPMLTFQLQPLALRSSVTASP